MADDFAGHFENGFSALLQAFGQPIGGLQRLAHKAFFIFGFEIAGDFSGIGLVDEHAGQRVGIKFDKPSAIGCFAHIHIGDNGLDRAAAKAQTGLWVERFDVGHHFQDVFVVQPREFSQRRKIAPC